MVTRATDNGCCRRESAWASDTTLYHRLLKHEGGDSTYGKQLVGHRHRRNRPCTFRSCSEQSSQHSAREIKRKKLPLSIGIHPGNIEKKVRRGGRVDIDVGAVLLLSCCVANRQRNNTGVQNGQRERATAGSSGRRRTHPLSMTRAATSSTRETG